MYISEANNRTLRKIAEIADSFLPEALMVDLDYDASLDDIADDISIALEKQNIEAVVKYGVTKIVIIPDSLPYVLKVGFDGFYDCGDEYVNDFDYCEEEANLYDIAEKAGFGDFFAEITYFMTGLSGHAFYVQ